MSLVQVLHLLVTLQQVRRSLWVSSFINAQGEDVVAGVRTPMPIAQMEQEFPEAYAEFLKVCETLEKSLP